MSSLWQDLRHGVRMMIHNPAVTVIAVIALALGIGPNTAIFSVVNALLLTPPSFPDPDSIVSVRSAPSGPPGAPRSARVSTDDFQDWRDSTQTLEHMALLEPNAVTLAGLEEPVQLRGWRATPELFSVLGVPPLAGRVFTPEDG
ncbi:MAG: hypothetical protein FJW35_10485, partial [Acidobacteria bacterium]|nr:hypothetical protein [Acidobacteriota bacterium]